MFRQFFAQIPEELIEAARIDGAGNWRIYWQLMLPLCGPVIAIVAIYTFLASWNDFLGPLIYLNSPENRTLALALNAFRGQYGDQRRPPADGRERRVHAAVHRAVLRDAEVLRRERGDERAEELKSCNRR